MGEVVRVNGLFPVLVGFQMSFLREAEHGVRFLGPVFVAGLKIRFPRAHVRSHEGESLTFLVFPDGFDGCRDPATNLNADQHRGHEPDQRDD